jgi:crotonobetainyl-CoA:carnitine CoA-transferase CaiB-like acyl-CoA transferase
MPRDCKADNSPPGALNGLRVLDLTSAMGQPCGRALADLGADVTLVEPPEGSDSRRMAPFAGGVPHPDKGIYLLSFNTNKRGIVLDLNAGEGRDRLRKLALNADVLLESSSPGHMDSLGLSYADLAAESPRLVYTSITPFGQTGPYRHFRANDFILGATGGYTFTEGEPGGLPMAPPHYQSYQLAGLHAAFATLMALRHCDRTGEGQQVDVAIHEVIAHCQMHFRDYAAQLDLGSRWGSLPGPKGGVYPANNYRCRDGWVVLAMTSERAWATLAEWSQDPVLLHPRFHDPDQRTAELALLDERIAAFIAPWDRDNFVEQATARRLNSSTMNSPVEFLRHPHTVQRDLFARVEHPVLGGYRAIGPPALYSRTPWRIRRPTPLLGQHTQEVLDDWTEPTAQPRQANGVPSSELLPLDGVRVTAFSRGWAAPYGTRYLGDFGAEVIKLESTKFSDGRTLDPEKDWPMWWELNTQFAEMNRNKLSATLDLHTPEGQDLFKQLTAVSDVVVENNKPGAMERFGLAYDDLQAVKPDIIMVRAPAYGTSGPLRDHPGIGQSLNGFTGMGYLWGQPGSPLASRSKLAYPDLVVSAHLALAIMAALRHRDRTGEGQQIEIPQFQTTATMVGTAYMEHFLNGDSPEPVGNRDWNAVPQGVYRCEGDDRWCAIACTSDGEWQALCSLIGQPGLADDPSLATPDQRSQRHDELDALIEQWTLQRTSHQAMLICQRAGVPAGIVANGEDLYRDPQLRERGYIVSIAHQVPGPLEHPGMTVRFTRTPGRVRYPSPVLGEHTTYVLQNVLGIGDGQQRELEAAGAIS